MNGRAWTKAEDDFLRGLYHVEGVACADIAQALARSISSVYLRARALGLNRTVADYGPAFEAFLREKHGQGWSDAEIARAWPAGKGCQGLDRHAVGAMRKRLGLPANVASPHRRDRVRAKTREQLERAGLHSLAEVRVKAFRDYARACGWPEDLRPREVHILNALYERGPMTRVEIARAIGWNMEVAARSKFGQRKLLASGGSSKHYPNDRGSYLANLTARGMVIVMKRVVRTGRKGGNVNLYSLPLNIERRTTS